jgi:hypothetical protein
MPFLQDKLIGIDVTYMKKIDALNQELEKARSKARGYDIEISRRL